MGAKEWSPNQKLILFGFIFLLAYFIPFDSSVVKGALDEAFLMLSDYARQHVLLCLIPAFFIAGAIMVFLNQQSVIKYLGPKSNPLIAYSVASISGAILAVCSCTVLPLFKGIYKKGAGLGPAVSFLYSGPAISILAIVFSFKVFGFKLGMARVIGSIVFALVIGMLMHLIFKKEDEKRQADERMFLDSPPDENRKLWQNALPMALMIAILVFLNWASSEGELPIWDFIYQAKWWISGALGLGLLSMLLFWFKKSELKDWVISTRDFSIQILPLLFGGVLIAGFLLGKPKVEGFEGLIPSSLISGLVGGNSLLANLFAAVSGAFMYFATLTEVPIVEKLVKLGMGQGPTLALLLAGPSLSLPSMLVIKSELGLKKTIVYVALVVILSTLAGFLFGLIA